MADPMADHDLRHTIGALRRDVPMRPEWRSAVLRDVGALPFPEAPARGSSARGRAWAFRPATAVAAGLLCAVVGGGLTFGVVRLATGQRRETAAVPVTGESRGTAPVRFVLVAPRASTVTLVGDFNGWSRTATPLRRTGGALWSVDLPLSPGRHTYAFVVDGVLIADPNALDSADDDFGVRSSVVLVSDPHRT
jgi:hypothetical protein